jgi:hypothetical protein
MPGRVYAIRSGPVYLFKIDISDGFYRISIRSEDVPKLAIMFPTGKGEERLIVQPLVLPMGWTPPLCSRRRPKRLQILQTESFALDKPDSHTA